MVGGKTGTSEKLDPDGGYFKDRNLATFAATFPVHAQIVLVVLIDEPKGPKALVMPQVAGLQRRQPKELLKSLHQN